MWLLLHKYLVIFVIDICPTRIRNLHLESNFDYMYLINLYVVLTVINWLNFENNHLGHLNFWKEKQRFLLKQEQQDYNTLCLSANEWKRSTVQRYQNGSKTIHLYDIREIEELADNYFRLHGYRPRSDRSQKRFGAMLHVYTESSLKTKTRSTKPHARRQLLHK